MAVGTEARTANLIKAGKPVVEYDSFCVCIDSRNAGLVVRLSLGRDQTLRFPLDREYLAAAPRV